ncbi:MAG: cyclic nucleotide-binding protein [Pseudopedobacter saltans]|uniref:Cyclic nucleotide-binding protein n=1 Tax=Pseudopedobacter saltans TaxID=151895 RepID=A0A2W5F327_9SPHI|nr:MAG: cyclic nucleotide-binding protein [Pseudopedobacter saltans]
MTANLSSQSLEPLLEYFDGLIPLNEQEQTLVSEYFKPRLYRKRQYVLQEEDVCTQFNFVVKGCLRLYKIDESGNTHILQFASENWWLSNIGSFHQRTASELNIDALEDTMVFQISYENLIALYTNSPKFDRIFRVLIENSYVALQNRMLLYISSTAEDRYDYFTRHYHHLANRLPQTQIAAYLGITPEFLSRLRNRRVHKKP